LIRAAAFLSEHHMPPCLQLSSYPDRSDGLIAGAYHPFTSSGEFPKIFLQNIKNPTNFM